MVASTERTVPSVNSFLLPDTLTAVLPENLGLCVPGASARSHTAACPGRADLFLSSSSTKSPGSPQTQRRANLTLRRRAIGRLTAPDLIEGDRVDHRTTTHAIDETRPGLHIEEWRVSPLVLDVDPSA